MKELLFQALLQDADLVSGLDFDAGGMASLSDWIGLDFFSVFILLLFFFCS
jgi:hypothetical protein